MAQDVPTPAPATTTMTTTTTMAASSKRRARPGGSSGVVAANAATAMASLTFDPADIGVPAQTADGAQMPPFLVKLWHLVLTVPKDVGRWAQDGSRFEVLRPKAFSEHVLHEFRGEGASMSADALLRVMNTFTRQLHFYSFRRNEMHEAGYAAGAWAFQHPSFVEGHPEKLAFIRRFSRASDRDRLDPQLAAAYAATTGAAATAAGTGTGTGVDGPSAGRRPSRASARRARKRVARYDDSSDDSDAFESEPESDDGDVTDAADDESDYGGHGTRGRKSLKRRGVVGGGGNAPVMALTATPGATLTTPTATTAMATTTTTTAAAAASEAGSKRQRGAVPVSATPTSPPVAREPEAHHQQHVGPAPEPFWVVSEAPSGMRLHDEMPSLGYLSEDLMNPNDDSAGIAGADADHERVLRRFLTEAEFAPLVTPKAVGSISWSALPPPTTTSSVAAAPPAAKRAAMPVLDSTFGWFPDSQQQWPIAGPPRSHNSGSNLAAVPTPVSRSTSVVVPGEDLDLVVEALK